jgi:hypothetical protein
MRGREDGGSLGTLTQSRVAEQLAPARPLPGTFEPEASARRSFPALRVLVLPVLHRFGPVSTEETAQ